MSKDAPQLDDPARLALEAENKLHSENMRAIRHSEGDPGRRAAAYADEDHRHLKRMTQLYAELAERRAGQ